MAKLQVYVPDELYDRFKRKHFRELSSAIVRLIKKDLEE